MIRLGYNTNGLAHHELFQGLEMLADLGYTSVALTIDHGCLNPFAEDLPLQIGRCRQALARHGMTSVIETGARYLLNAQVKHEPTLVSADPAERSRRVSFLCRAIDLAAELQSDCVSLWSGSLRDSATFEQGMDRLRAGLEQVLRHAERRGVVIGFEPEPGMLIDTMDRFDELCQGFQSAHFQLTLDMGHLHCQGEQPIAGYIERYQARLVNVHIEDMWRGVHEHRMFGEGEMDFPPVIDALKRVDYEGGLHVELSRHSHVGPEAARQAYEFLAPMLQGQPR